LDAHVLEGFGQLDDGLTIVVPAAAGLSGEGGLLALEDSWARKDRTAVYLGCRLITKPHKS